MHTSDSAFGTILALIAGPLSPPRHHGAMVCSVSSMMGAMWMGGVAIYGAAVSQLGSRGPSVGWALIQTTTILAGNLVGLMMREWQETGVRFRAGMIAGLALLFIGIAVVSAPAFV